MRRNSFIIALILLPMVSRAQHNSRLGRFSIDATQGCAPLSITITNTNLMTTGECTTNKPCQMNFMYGESNQQHQNKTQFEYTNPGTYTLSILYSSIGRDDITIKVEENKAPSFSLYACRQNQVYLKIVPNKYDQYRVNFGDSSPPRLVRPSAATLNHSYTQSNREYTISVQGIYLSGKDNCAIRNQTFQTKNQLSKPHIDYLRVVSDNSIESHYRGEKQVLLFLDMGMDSDASFIENQSLGIGFGFSNTKKITVSGIDVRNHYYCFRVRARDPCITNDLTSDIMCSDQLSVTPVSDAIKLTWNSSKNYKTGTRIYRNNRYITSLDGPNILSYTDQDVQCQVEYCYQLNSSYSSGRSLSAKSCARAFSTKALPSISDISIAVNPAYAEIQWFPYQLENKIYTSINRLISHEFIKKIATVRTSHFKDIYYQPARSFCYTIQQSDACGNVSPTSSIACPIELTGGVDKSNQVSLSWSSYKNWSLGVANYNIHSFDQTGTLLSIMDVGKDTTFTEQEPDLNIQKVSYQVVAHPASRSIILNSTSNVLPLIKNTNIYAPTAFTPNGDQINDTFIVSGQYLKKVDFWIFDRWGNEIYFSNKGVPWNGSSTGGRNMPSLPYVWKAVLTDQLDRVYHHSGTVLLIR